LPAAMITLKDEYTVVLGISALAIYAISKFLVPPSLVHPLLLGRQSHVAQVRKEHDSAVYTNYGIGSSTVCLFIC
jgi:long-chain acyl-CoA synthetase